jgi:Caudovirus prohead serine protease
MTAQICAMKKTFVVSDSSLNSFGFRMLTEGLTWGENVPMFFNHDDTLPAIGHWENFRFEGDDLLADAVFDMDDPMGASLAKKVEKGHIKAASIGASPLALSEEASDMVAGQTLPTITAALIKEVSICNIGSNRSALALYDGMGTKINLSEVGALVKLSISINQNFDNELKEVSMKQIAKFLKLSDTATEAEVLTEIQQLKDTNVALEVKLGDFSKAEGKRKKDEAKGLLDVALSENRIGGDERPLFEKMFDADYDAAKGMLALRLPQVKLSQVVNTEGAQGGTVELKYNGKTWDELDKSNGLDGLKTANFELFKLMFKGKFSRAYTNLY